MYNPEHQKLKINKAETKMVDGKIVPSPDNAFNEILPFFASGVPAYNYLREMVVTHTGLEPGCLVNFDYEINSEAGYLPYLSDDVVLKEEVPVENLQIIVKVPENVELNYKLINTQTEAVVSQKDGFKIYKWNFKDIDGEIYEPNQPHDQSFLPRLVFSSANLQDAISNMYSESDLKLSGDIQYMLRNKIFGINNSVKMIREFQKIVGDELNDFKIPIEYTDYKIRPLNEVWNSNGGTSIEKAFLLNEFIKYIGFESKVIMTLPPSYYDKSIGCLKEFGHFYVLAKVDGQDIIFSTNPKQDNNLAFELKDEGILDLEGNSVNVPDFIDNTESLVATSGNLKLSENGNLTGDINIKVQGLKNPYLKYLDDVENAKEIATSLFSSSAISDFNVVEFDHTKSELNTKIEKKEAWKNQGDYFFLEIPSSNYGIKGEHLRTLLGERQNPLKLSYPINESYDFKIATPEGFTLVKTINEQLDNELGSVKIEISSDGNLLHIVKSLNITKDEINPADYTSFKALIEIWDKKPYNEIILKK